MSQLGVGCHWHPTPSAAYAMVKSIGSPALVLAVMLIAHPCVVGSDNEVGALSPFDYKINTAIRHAFPEKFDQAFDPSLAKEALRSKDYDSMSIAELALFNLKLAMFWPMDGEFAATFRFGGYCDKRKAQVAERLSTYSHEELRILAKHLQVPETRVDFLIRCMHFWGTADAEK